MPIQFSKFDAPRICVERDDASVCKFWEVYVMKGDRDVGAIRASVHPCVASVPRGDSRCKGFDLHPLGLPCQIVECVAPVRMRQ